MPNARPVLCAVLTLAAFAGRGLADVPAEGPQIAVTVAPAGVTSLTHPGDAFETDYVASGHALGNLVLSFRSPGDDAWTSLRTDRLPGVYTPIDGHTWHATQPLSDRLSLVSTLTLEPAALRWSFTLRNTGDRPIEIGDLAITTPFNTQFSQSNSNVDAGSFEAHRRVLEERLMPHFLVAGHGSFLFLMRPNTVGPYLVMTPTAQTKLEYFDNDAGDAGPQQRREPRRPTTSGTRPATTQLRPVGRLMYIHSAATAELLQRETVAWEQANHAPQHTPAWRQPHTSITLTPAGQAGDHIDYGFTFRFAPKPTSPDATAYDGVRQVLYEQGGYDINVAPGMTVPTDLTTLVAIRTKNPIDALVPEFPGQTQVEAITSPPTAPPDQHLFRVRFSKLGENLLTIRSGDQSTPLEFFITEPLETLVRKRAAFLVSDRSRWVDSGKWYEGLITEWDALHHVKRSPDDLDGLRKYIVSCDDPGLGKAPYVASKNATFPDQAEVAALDYYIDHFVWGGLQMTEQEPHPYAIYGIETWYENRHSNDPGRNGRGHVWRIYDYPHLVLLYYRMYQIAAHYPRIHTQHSADEYLTRAYRTAIAYFTVPTMVEGWSAYYTGTYNEVIIPEVIDALAAAGRAEEADALRAHWEQKVKAFIFERDPYLFGSEYAFDSTTFEGSAALAKWAVERMAVAGYQAPPALPTISERGGPPRAPQAFPSVAPDAANAFLERQVHANIADRGWVETAYYYLGSDYRGGFGSGYLLSYMSQMGGWGVMDYALNHATSPAPYARLAYASNLSSWALLNSGTPQSNYGYWFPGPENDGSAGGGFEPRAFSRAWIGKTTPRGSWYYACEIDLGFSGALRSAATIVIDDPLFGRVALGGELSKTDAGVAIIPRDGVRQRFHLLLNNRRLQMTLDRDGFAAEQPITIDATADRITFTLENRVGQPHHTTLRLRGIAPGAVQVEGVRATVRPAVAGDVDVDLEIGQAGSYPITIVLK